MEVIWLLLPIALIIAGLFLVAYVWAVRSGQFDDTTTPAFRILIEEDLSPDSKGDIDHSVQKPGTVK